MAPPVGCGVAILGGPEVLSLIVCKPCLPCMPLLALHAFADAHSFAVPIQSVIPKRRRDAREREQQDESTSTLATDDGQPPARGRRWEKAVRACRGTQLRAHRQGAPAAHRGARRFERRPPDHPPARGRLGDRPARGSPRGSPCSYARKSPTTSRRRHPPFRPLFSGRIWIDRGLRCRNV